MVAFDPFTRPEFLKDTQRYKSISLLERIYDGKQYEGRPDFWTGQTRNGGPIVPLRERKPCIIYKLPQAATLQVVRFLFGEQRFPRVALEKNKDSEQTDQWYPKVSDEQAEIFDSWVASLIEHADVQPMMRAIAAKAISCKTAPVVLELFEGQFRYLLPRPQDCWAAHKNNDPSLPVTRFLWCYEFDKEVAGDDGKPTSKRHIFRREWDETSVHVYPDVELKHGVDIQWPAPVSTAHGLSFCPALWIRNDADYTRDSDGRSLYEGLEDEFEALDMTLSRRHQGLIYLGSPQLVETGVEEGDGPDQNGAKAGASNFGREPEYKTTQRARRIGPDSVWTYEGKDVTVELLETSGKAFEVATNHVNDIRSRLLETMGVVLTSMADTTSRVTTGADMSARFLALAHAPLIALVQEYRHSWWAAGLRPVISMMMRMTIEASAAQQIVLVPNTERALPVLQLFKTDAGWIVPRMVPHWGRFFDPSSTEIKTSVEAAVSARDGRLISSGTATEHVAHDFAIESPEKEAEEIEADKQAAAEEAAAQQASENPNGSVSSSNGRANGLPGVPGKAGSGSKPSESGAAKTKQSGA